MIRYTNQALIITVPTSTPSAIHEMLLRSVNLAMKTTLHSPHLSTEERQTISCLSQLQAALLPTENELEKGITIEKE